MRRIIVLLFIAVTIISALTTIVLAVTMDKSQPKSQSSLYEKYIPNLRDCNTTEFEKVIPIDEYRSKVYKNGKWGLIDNYFKPAKLITDITYDDIQLLVNSDFRGGALYKVSKNKKWGFFEIVSITQNEIYYSKIIFDDIEQFNPWVGKVLLNGKYAAYFNDKLVSDFKYENIEPLNKYSTYLIVTYNSKKGLYTPWNQKEVTDLVYDDFRDTIISSTFKGRKHLIEGKKGDVWTKILIIKT